MTQRKLLRQTHNIMVAPKKKLGLLPKLIIAIVLGLIIGTIARSANLPIIIRIGATFNSIFGNFLGFCIPLIIIGFVAPGIADLGSGAGKTLAITAGIAYLSTLISGTFAYLVDSAIFPSFLKIGSIVMDNAHGNTKFPAATRERPQDSPFNAN